MIYCSTSVTILLLQNQEGGNEMPRVVKKDNESLDDVMRRFKRQVSRNGTLAEARKREYYVKPGVKKKLKSEAARKKRSKKKR